MRGNFKTIRKGIENPNYMDGRKKTRLYRIYRNMLTRCRNPNSASFKWYGSKGISVCEEWSVWEAFRDWALSNGYEEHLTIDRVDNQKGYCPENCRWTDCKSQSRNRGNNHIIQINGRCLTLIEWSEQYAINYHTVQDRLRRGWSEIQALTTPVPGKRVIRR